MTEEVKPPDPTPEEKPAPDQPAADQPPAAPEVIPLEIEPQKVPSFANWTQEEKDKFYERLDRIEKGNTRPEEKKPEPEPDPEPKPIKPARKRGLRYKRK